ncbi:MAG: hypothetical protein GF364_12965 [Candidatus Lokiarchaeota archaeon]|nr:hypothetical protein [Candidatus Lokiarchaeota archaeon]
MSGKNKKNKPNPIPKKLRKYLLKNLPSGLIDNIAEYIHDSWWEEKSTQGFHHPSEKHKQWDPSNPKKYCDKCHLDMIPYDELPESSKIFDKVTVETTLAALRLIGYHVHPNPGKRKFNMKIWKKEHK